MRPIFTSGDSRAQELRQRELIGLEFGIGQLDPERHAKAVPSGGVQGQVPDGMKIERAGLGLHVPPVTAYVEHVDERQTRDVFDVTLERFTAGSSGKRRTAFFPRVSDETQAGVALWLFRRRGEQERQPPLILVDVERTLIQRVAGR